MNQLKRLRHHLTRRRLNPPLGFVHIPKAAGTAVVQRLESVLRPRHFIYGLDRSQFGAFAAFETMPASTRATIFDDENEIPAFADVIAGHLSPKTIHGSYPSARLITILRTPASRLLSHWFYWRGYGPEVRAQYGDWGKAIAYAQADLGVFLQERQIACVTDNIIVRMLLWPHKLIPDDDFINPRDDDQLLAEAMQALNTFSFVHIIEVPAMMTSLEHWLRRTYGYSFWSQIKNAQRHRSAQIVNVSKSPVVKMTTPLSVQLMNGADNDVKQRTRLDDVLWYNIATRYFNQDQAKTVYARSVTSAVARYEHLNNK